MMIAQFIAYMSCGFTGFFGALLIVVAFHRSGDLTAQQFRFAILCGTGFLAVSWAFAFVAGLS